jgi:hypothetical protein
MSGSIAVIYAGRLGDVAIALAAAASHVATQVHSTGATTTSLAPFEGHGGMG